MVERIAVVGLEFAGRQLALALACKFPDVVAFDADVGRVDDFRKGLAVQQDAAAESLRTGKLRLTAEPGHLTDRTFFIVAPVAGSGRPDLSPVEGVSALVGRALARGAVVVYEATCFPGFTEEVCGPILERESGLRRGLDFKIGYSPERINPGDAEHTLEKVVKVVSGEDAETLDRVAAVYAAVVHVGVHRAPSIKVAEAAKVIENTQRDLNVALMNELAMVFDRAGLRGRDVRAAAGTKWNFAKFEPGLLGGDGVIDRHYLAMGALRAGYESEVLLAGQRVNDGICQQIAQKLVKLMLEGNVRPKAARVGVLGITAKENVNDVRTSKVPDVVRELRQFGVEALVHDPLANPAEALRRHGVRLTALDEMVGLDVLVLAVCHKTYMDLGQGRLEAMVRDGGVLADIKGQLDPDRSARGVRYWSL